jgi:hypothetical protein
MSMDLLFNHVISTAYRLKLEISDGKMASILG